MWRPETEEKENINEKEHSQSCLQWSHRFWSSTWEHRPNKSFNSSNGLWPVRNECVLVALNYHCHISVGATWRNDQTHLNMSQTDFYWFIYMKRFRKWLIHFNAQCFTPLKKLELSFNIASCLLLVINSICLLKRPTYVSSKQPNQHKPA